MAGTAWSVDRLAAPATRADAPRHAALVRVTHWLTAVCVLALLVSGLEIVVSHPRFYWGESGNVLTPALFSLPIPASRATVPTGYGYVLKDQNGWSRALHFQAAWVLVVTGALYVIWGAVSGHFRNHLLPEASDLPVAFGGPLRVRVPRQLGYKSVKFINRLAVTDSLKQFGKGLGSASPEDGYAWYAGI
jgi:Prokaryotic cytochrome b561/Oxidoreductase molybdopterin binding domain